MSLSILSKEQAPQGSDFYRDNAVVVPNAYKPTLVHSVKPNASGTNHNVTVRSDDHVVSTVDGKEVVQDSFILTTKFTSLQSVIASTERARIFDGHLAYLTAIRQDFLDGTLPDEPVVLA